MAKKPLISDNKLSWIKDTTVGEEKPSAGTIPETDDLPARKEVAKAKTKTKATAAEPGSKTAAQLPSKPGGAQKVAAKKKRPPRASRPTKPIDPARTELHETKPEAAPESKQEPTLGVPPSYQDYLWPRIAEEINPVIVQEKNRKQDMLVYLASIAALLAAAIFVPEPYGILVFLGFIFIALVEILFRMGNQYHLLKAISENLAGLLRLSNRK
jgi:hypothetical protein